MPKYVIERDIPRIGDLTPQQLKDGSQKSCDAIRKIGPQIQWVQSYVTADKLYCVYVAPNEELIQQHARESGFPAHRISEVKTIIDPTTAGL